MKRIFMSISLLLFVLTVFSQERLSFEKVIKAEDVNKRDIYVGIKEWIGLNYKSAKAVTEIDDKDGGLIIISPLTKYSMKGLSYSCYAGSLKYTVKFKIRDSRFKVEVTNFVHNNNAGNSSKCNLGLLTTAENYTNKGMQKGYDNKVWQDLKEKAEILANELFTEIETINFNNPSLSDDDDW